MFTNIALSVGMLVAVFAAPDVSKMQLVGAQHGMCPDDREVTLSAYQGDNDEKVIQVELENKVAALVSLKEQKVYILSTKEVLTVTESLAKYPNACSFPSHLGV